MTQRFYADKDTAFKWPSGAIGYRTACGPFDCLGPFAKVVNCRVDGTDKRYTCYATNFADTYFSVPACTRIKGKYVKGFFMSAEEDILFVPYGRFTAYVRGKGPIVTKTQEEAMA